MAKTSRNVRKQRIKKDLMEQLESHGKTASYWYDLVEDYLTFWEMKEKLKVEVERHGAIVVVQNGSQIFRKRSDAIVEMPKISKRMTDILEVLDIKATVVEEEDDDDDY